MCMPIHFWTNYFEPQAFPYLFIGKAKNTERYANSLHIQHAHFYSVRKKLIFYHKISNIFYTVPDLMGLP